MSYINRAYFTISNTPSTSGALTVSTAVSGPYRTLGAAHDGMSFDVAITDGSAWEVRTGCTYTHSGTSLSRGTLKDSSTGSAIDLTSAAQVMVTSTADFETLLDIAMQSILPGGRLTTESGVPVSTSDRTSQSTLYYTPFVHDKVPLWDGARWAPTTFSETSIALSGLTSGKPYDVFGHLSGGALALELLVWTNDTTRATAVTLQDGRYCKSGDKTRLLLGTIYTTGTTTTEDSENYRYVGNVYNLRTRQTSMILTSGVSSSHSYNSTTRRYFNNDSTARFLFVASLAGVKFAGSGHFSVTAAGGIVDLGFNSSTTGTPGSSRSAGSHTINSSGVGAVTQPGLNYVALLESSSTTVTIEWPRLRGAVEC